jgi:hypothetical protein
LIAAVRIYSVDIELATIGATRSPWEAG